VQIHEIAREAGRTGQRIAEMLSGTLVDLDSVIEQVVMATIAGGHVLLEGVPGTAKTTLCRSLGTALGMDYRRIQFTPDLLPSDVTGTKIFNQSRSEFVLQTGPVFCQLLLADELNRAPARTQSALLEAMQERQVTIEGETLPLPRPFIVLATQNPVEQEGVYRLPEAQLDRFMFRVRVGYPQRTGEIELLEMQESPARPVEQVCQPEDILRLQRFVDAVHASRELKAYIVDLIRTTRDHRDVLLGASPRAGIFMLRAARARALLHDKTFCTHEDVQSVAHPVLEHRVIMRPEAELSGRHIRGVLTEVIESVPIREG
jgi:MoxR-like ATPase